MEIFAGLNDAQRQAAAVQDGHVLVVAGPGTGKTLTIVRRIGHLLDQGIRPHQILALTFSNRAAREMKERVRAFVGEAAVAMFAGTFHLFGLRMLRSVRNERRTLCTRQMQVDRIRTITGKGIRFAEKMCERISMVKNGAALLDDEAKPIYHAYEAALATMGEWDFDDLLRIPVELLDLGDLGDQYGRYSHIIVDEYQDVSPVQYRFLRGLSARSRACVWAVGDPDQAIYSFRGAHSGNFRDFLTDFAPARLIVLKENYRSTQTVVGASDAVIAHNQERISKELNATREEGEALSIISVPDERAEAQLIVHEIETRMGGTSHYRIMSHKDSRDYGENTYGFSDFAVLFRTNAQAAVVREALESWGIPSQMIGGTDRGKIEMLIRTMESRRDGMDEDSDVETLIKSLCEETGMSHEDQRLLEGIGASYGHESPQTAVQAVIDELTLLAAPDRYDKDAHKVALMTMHAAKGLEFRVIFVAGCSEGLIPYAKAGEPPEVEEERRLFYVAMTRAKEELFMLCPRRHVLYGQRMVRAESPFLSEIPGNFLRRVTVADPPKKPPKGRQQSLF